jgi:hypothetical protein
MPYDELWEIMAGPDWRLMAAALVLGTFLVAAVLIRNISRLWKRIGTIETQISKMQNEITTVLQLYAALIRKPNANAKVEIDPHGTAVKMGGGDVAGQMHPTASAQPESAKSAKLPVAKL